MEPDFDYTMVEHKVTPEQFLEYMFLYAKQISRLVSPMDAKQYCGFVHDGAIGETFGDIGLHFMNNGTLEEYMEKLNTDEFYNETFNRIKTGVDKFYEKDLTKLDEEEE